jgi:hypothetical protein
MFFTCHVVGLLGYNCVQTCCNLLDCFAPNDLHNTLLKRKSYVADHPESGDSVLAMLNIQALLININFNKVGCEDWRCIALVCVRVQSWALVLSALQLRIDLLQIVN